jgi:hypothetical protein
MQVPAPHDQGTGAASPADIEHSIVDWLRDELDDPEITGSDNFLDIGGHSLTFSKLNKVLSDSYGAILDRRTTYEEPLSVAAAKAQSIENAQPTSR